MAQAPHVVTFLTGSCFLHAVSTSRLAINGGDKEQGGYFVSHEADKLCRAVCLVEYLGKIALAYSDKQCMLEDLDGKVKESLRLHPTKPAPRH